MLAHGTRELYTVGVVAGQNIDINFQIYHLAPSGSYRYHRLCTTINRTWRPDV